MDKQVDKKAYSFSSYSFPGRWVSYFHQIGESLALKPDSILEVGTGDGVYKNYILNNTKILYKNLDIAQDLNPDIVGTVDNIPLENDSFDLVCAFEVLEHLPFERFEKCLSELKRVSKKYIIISLPHFGPPIKFCLKIPFIKEIKFSFKIPFSIRHVFDGQHYWEIGKTGYSSRKIKKIIKSHFVLMKDFIPFENQYHHFYILKK